MIIYVNGDATDPQTPGKKIIAHVCNDEGGWGRGFVMSLSKRWVEPESSYRRWFKERNSDELEHPPFELGNTVFVPVTSDIYVANMIAQRGTRRNVVVPIRYDALEECLRDVEMWARDNDHASVHMPRIGCGLAGGNWSEVEKLVSRVFIDTEVYVYDFVTGDTNTVPWKA